ncbi:MAG: hypothetical protein ABIS21_04325 [Acidimicrobiales bacterium]
MLHEIAAHERASWLWGHAAYYCARDDIVYAPGTAFTIPRQSLRTAFTHEFQTDNPALFEAAAGRTQRVAGAARVKRCRGCATSTWTDDVYCGTCGSEFHVRGQKPDGTGT